MEAKSLIMSIPEGPDSIRLESAASVPNSSDGTELLLSPGDQHHSLLLEHQQNELKHPDVSIHSCSYCRVIAISTAPETEGEYQAMRVIHSGEDGPDSEQSLLTSGWAREAAANGCALFSALAKDSYYLALSAQPDNVLQFQYFSHEGQTALTILESSNRSYASVLGRFELYAIPESESSSHSPQGDPGRVRPRETGLTSQNPAGGTQQPPNTTETLLPPNLVPASNLSYTRARLWLKDCQENHTECAKFNLVSMPTRVLEVIPGHSLSEPNSFKVRLLENPEPSPYATLSYCWGGEQSFKTTQARLDSYKRNIPLANLAQTIQDALTVVHAVGLRYLWIDALCIVQDDDKDKMREITSMHRIYRGSFFTVAAGTARSSREGFLQPRIPYRGFKVKTKTADGVTHDLLAIPLRTPVDEMSYPLYKRAWTFQEDYLSTRILAYGNRGLVYKCLEASHCDGGHQKCSIWRMGDENAAGALLNRLRPGSQQLRTEAHPLAWCSTVEDYTNRLLSFPDDKLLAIAALAEEYSRTQPVTEYLAGMWKEDLLHQCLWQRKRPIPNDHPGVSRPKRYRAPSWSWASLDGPFHPFRPEQWSDGARPSFSCRLIDAKTTLADESNVFGQVTGGMLRVYGRMRRLAWVCPHPDRSTLNGYGWALDENDTASDDDDPESRDDKRLDFIVDDLEEWPPYTKVAMWCIEFCTFMAPDNVMILARRDFNEERGSRMHLEGRGLLLLPVSTGENEMTPTTFRRVGMVGFKGIPKGDSYYEREPYWFDDGDSEWREIVIL